MKDTTEIRRGEELDTGKLRAFLRENLNATTDEIEISQFPAGSSNLT